MRTKAGKRGKVWIREGEKGIESVKKGDSRQRQESRKGRRERWREREREERENKVVTGCYISNSVST